MIEATKKSVEQSVNEAVDADSLPSIVTGDDRDPKATKVVTSLAANHLQDLQKSGLTIEMMEKMRVRSVPPLEIDKLCAGQASVESVLEFPYDDKFSRYKLFPPIEHSDGKLQKYHQSCPGCRLYILDRVKPVLTDPSVPLLVVEGEKKTALAVQHGLMAVGVAGVWNWIEKGTGAGIVDLDRIAWPERKVEVVFDSDTWVKPQPQQALYALMRELEDRGANVSTVVLPGHGEDKVGFDDFVTANNIDGFAKLPRLTLTHAALDRQKAWWKAWKAKFKKENQETSGLHFQPVDLWPDPIVGVELLNDIRDTVKRFIVIETEAMVAEALWILFAHTVDAFGVAPMLAFSSPVRQCGKSSNQALIGRLVPKPLITSNITPGALFRCVEKFSPTLIVDECDSAFSTNSELRELVNASHLRSQAYVWRCTGDSHEPTQFCTWAAKCLALIGELPDTTSSRSIVIKMRRKGRGDKVERFSPMKAYPELRTILQKAARWASDNIVALRAADPEALIDANDRDQDNWLPLFAIADLAGGEWPKLARDAAAKLSGEPQEESTKIELLKDIKMIFLGDPEDADDEGCDTISSADLVTALKEKEHRPWADFNKGKGITANQLARLIKPFGVPTNHTVRKGKETFKGYQVDWFKDAFERYLPNDSTEVRSQQSQPNDKKDLRVVQPQSQSKVVTDDKHDLNTQKQRGVTDVTADQPDGGWEEL